MIKLVRLVVLSLSLSVLSVYADIERVSVSSTGKEANDVSYREYINADGRYVLFTSYADNLVQQDTNNWADVFIKDRQTSMIKRVSVSSTGDQANSISVAQGLSADGRYALFYSYANNLVPEDTNNKKDIFIHDLQTGVTERVSVSSTGMQANDDSSGASMSADGRFIAFSSIASNLVPLNTNKKYDAFIHDRLSGTTERVSVSSTGMQANGSSFSPTISADGRYVGFRSFANNIVQQDTNNEPDIFVYDRLSGKTERVSVSSGGTQANGGSGFHSISADARIVGFESHASNLVIEDTNNGTDIFAHDRITGITERINVSSLDEQSELDIYVGISDLSSDGRYVSFASSAGNLIPGGVNNSGVFVRDRQTRTTELISVSSSGAQANDTTYGGVFSADGHYLAFYSKASNLVEGDSNNIGDVFITDNPLIDEEKLIVEKLINNNLRKAQSTAARLSTGTQYKQHYKVTNGTDNRLYQVRVFEAGNQECNFYALNPGEIKEGCISFQSVLEGDQHAEVIVTAKTTSTNEIVTGASDVYYKGFTNVPGLLDLTYTVNDLNADHSNPAIELSAQQASFQFKIENTGVIELYGIKTYHDPVTPVNSGWNQQCIIGTLKPGQVRYCKRDITLSESGLNNAMGRVQGRNAIISPTEVINASDPTYFVVP